MQMSAEVRVEEVLRVVSYGVVSYEARRVEGLDALELREVGLLEVFELCRVRVGMGVIVPVV